MTVLKLREILREIDIVSRAFSHRLIDTVFGS